MKTALGCGLVILFMWIVVWTPTAQGYPYYDDGAGNGCVQCHSGFETGPSSVLHARHQSNFGITECNLCHSSGPGSTPVATFVSGAGGGYGCAGCHGVDYGETSPTSLQPKATAYGLRQHHVNNGVPGCPGCHVAGALGHPDPLPAILPENVAPPYYGLASSDLTDPCSSTQEDATYDGDTVGLDNDGDGVVDFPSDPDCPMPVTTTTTLPATCAPAPTGGCLTPEKGVLLVKETVSGKEKVRVVINRLQSTVGLGQLGDPVAGDTSYAVCIYDDADALVGAMEVARAGQDCGPASEPCWKAISDSGYKYLDKGASADGILKMLMKGGSAGEGKILVLGRNNAAKGQASLPTGIAAALLDSSRATVQLLTSDAACFGVTTDDVKRADGVLFKALGGSASGAFVDGPQVSVLH